MADFRFLAEHHLRDGPDFQRAYRRRCAASDDMLLVYGHPNGLDHPRLGLSVSRKVGPAVIRNRWKRLIREAFRLERAALPVGVDLVVIPRRDVRPELGALRRSLRGLAGRVARKLKPKRSTADAAT